MVSNIKRTLSIESLFPAFKAHCPDLEPSFDNFLVDEPVEPVESAVEIKNPFAAQGKSTSPRWPLEQPEIPLTFSVLNSKQQPLEEAVAPAPALLEPAEAASDESCDEYFNYDSLPSSPTSPAIEKRTMYFPQPLQPTWADNVKLNRKRVRAAWGLLGSVQNREAYYEQVMLASQSLNTTSLFSGLARQTMAPAP